MPLDGDPERTAPRVCGERRDVDLTGREIGSWRVGAKIATGGFGVIHEATHTASGRGGALKALHGHLVESPDMVGRLLREADAISRLHHPAVVELFDTGVIEDGRPYFVMERLHGVDLARALDDGGRRTPAQALEILEPVCAALELAHQRGIVHRDVKASNVFLCNDGRVVLLDFGIAKLADGLDLTRSRQVLGTPASMAPEQIRGEAVDARADVYGLGALAFHVLTGRTPFEEVSTTMSQYLHLHAQRPAVSACAPVPPALDAVVGRAMSIDPRDRFSGPLPFFAALRGVIAAGAEPPRRVAGAAAILVSARSGADPLDDLDDVLRAAERSLAAAGFSLVLDLGDAALFVAPVPGTAAAEIARRLHDELGPAAARVTIAAQHGEVEITGDQVTGGPLVDLATWSGSS